MTNPRPDHHEGPPMTPTKKQPSAEVELAAVVVMLAGGIMALSIFMWSTVAVIDGTDMPTLARVAVGFVNGTIAYRSVRWSIRTLKDAV